VFAVKEPATPWHAKAFGADVDDVLLLTALMWLAVKRLPARLLADGRIQADAWLQVQGRKTQRRMVSAAIGTAFVQDSADAARTQWRSVADQLRDKFPKLGTRMDDAENGVLAFMTFPRAHWTQIYSTNPLERLNAEIKRRTNVVGTTASLSPASTL